MIRECFTVFKGIGASREQAIKEHGIANWGDFLRAGEVPGLPSGLYQLVHRQILEWTEALERRDLDFLAREVPSRGHWALYGEFRDAVRYLDIETTGLSPGRDQVTVVGLYDGTCYRALIQGQGLTSQALREALGDCRLLVTYFGSVFDVPFLRVTYPDVGWDLPHYDLCFAGRRVGLRGGLKSVERALGIARGDGIADIDGFEAVRLWHAYQRGSREALERLVAYNEADTKNLARIADLVYARLWRPGT